MNLRKEVFFLRDKFLNNSKIRNNIERIGQKQSPQLIEEFIKDISKVTHHYSSYYEKVLTNGFKSLPIINKKLIVSNYDDFISGDKMDAYHIMKTSGSTGVPLISYQDKEKRFNTIAELIYFNQLAGQDLGNKFIYAKSFNKLPSKISNFIQNMKPIDIGIIDDELVEKIFDMLETRKYHSILSYASLYNYMAEYIEKFDIYRDMSGISLISSSSAFTKDTKKVLSDRLKVNIYDRYSNQEMGVIAQTYADYNIFEINPNYLVEILDDYNNHVEVGEIGRIVVTDLTNKYMPFVRYDTGDLGVCYAKNELQFTSRISEITGRRSFLIPLKRAGGFLSSHTISVLMRENNIQGWQLIKLDNIVYILIIGKYDDNTLSRLSREIFRLIGEEYELKILNSKQLHVLNSGKTELIINADSLNQNDQVNLRKFIENSVV